MAGGKKGVIDLRPDDSPSGMNDMTKRFGVADNAFPVCRYGNGALKDSTGVAVATMGGLSRGGARLDLSAQATIATARTLRLELRRFLAEHRIDPARVSDIQVAVGEAVNNAIEHAYSAGAGLGLVHLSGWFEGSTLVVEIRDHGRWRPEREERRGHGVRIMRALSDRLDLTTAAGTVVRLAFLPRSDPRAPSA